MKINKATTRLVGKPVMSDWHGITRYGIVRSEEVRDNKWKYCTVEWVNDDSYREAMKHLNEMRNDHDHTRYVYRVDELTFIDVDMKLKSLRALKKLTKEVQNV